MDIDILMCPSTVWGNYYKNGGGGGGYVCTDAHIEFAIISERFVHTSDFKYVHIF